MPISQEHKDLMDVNAGIACEYLNINPSQFLKHANRKKFVLLKYFFIYLSYEQDGIGFTEIGEYLDLKRNLVRDSDWRFKQRIKSDQELKGRLDEVLRIKQLTTKDTSNLNTFRDLDKNGLIIVHEELLIKIVKEYCFLKYKDKSVYTDILRDVIYEDILN